jgi:hypothetical protein
LLAEFSLVHHRGDLAGLGMEVGVVADAILIMR